VESVGRCCCRREGIGGNDEEYEPGGAGAAGDLMRKSVVVMRPAAAVMNDTYLRRPALLLLLPLPLRTAQPASPRFPLTRPPASCVTHVPSLAFSLSPLPCLHANDAMP